MNWTADPLERRRVEREQRLALARKHVEQIGRRIPVTGAVVAGSIARGDFNLWSDIDVVVVSDALPAPGPARAELLAHEAAPGLELHGYTSAEFTRALERGDRLALEAVESGVVLFGALPRAEPTGL
jgi:predicted nucleotidyltransferase